MISPKSTLLLTILLLLASLTPAAHSQSDDPCKPQLQFEISQTNNWPVTAGKYTPEPTYVAAVLYRGEPNPILHRLYATSTRNQPVPAGHPPMKEVFQQELNTVFNGSISKEQQDFNTHYTFLWPLPDPLFDRPLPRNTSGFCIYALSLEDAKTMAELTIQWANDQAHAQLTESQNHLKELQDRQAQLQYEIAEKQQQQKELQPKLDDAKKTVSYQTPEDVRKNITDLTRTLQSLQIDIAGSRAKLDTMKQRLTELQENPAPKVGEMILQMQVSEEIQLAGALARQQTIEKIIHTLSNFLGLTDQADTLSAAAFKLRNESADCKRNIASLEHTLANPPADLRPVDVVDNKVIIYPTTAQTDNPPEPAP